MVTASHNPPQDNGYKVYLGDGSQIVPPADAEIAADRSDRHRWRRCRGRRLGHDRRPGAGRGHLDSYLDTVAGLADDGPRDLAVVYTPLHGVGGTSVARCSRPPASPRRRWWRHRSSPTRTSRLSRSQPRGAGGDGPGARARRAERRRHRCGQRPGRGPAAPPPIPGPAAGGCCAATRSVRCWPRTCCAAASAARTPPRSCRRRCSASCPRPPRRQKYVETLTGFKWIGRLPGLAFGYEEALGYCVDPEHVADKDGVSALLLLCELAAAAKAAGRGLQDLLDDIAIEHGLHATDQVSVRVTDLGEIATAMARLRESPPAALGGLRSSTPRTSAPASVTCRRPTACATGSPTAPG